MTISSCLLTVRVLEDIVIKIQGLFACCASDSALVTIVRVYKLYLLTYLGACLTHINISSQTVFVISGLHYRAQ